MKKFIKYFLIIFVSVILIALIFGLVDYHRYKNNEKPIFTLALTYMDGGSVEYVGLGYQIIYFHMIEDYELGEDVILKDMAPIWYDFDQSYVRATTRTLGEFYSELTYEEKKAYFILKDYYNNDELEKIYESFDGGYKYALKLIEIYKEKSDVLSERAVNWIRSEVDIVYEKNIQTIPDEYRKEFDLFLFGKDFTEIDY